MELLIGVLAVIGGASVLACSAILVCAKLKLWDDPDPIPYDKTKVDHQIQDEEENQIFIQP